MGDKMTDEEAALRDKFIAEKGVTKLPGCFEGASEAYADKVTRRDGACLSRPTPKGVGRAQAISLSRRGLR